MANYAALIDTLSISGSRLTDGTANASGKVWFFQPGTNTTRNVYSDAAATTVVSQPITLGAGGKLPSNLSGGVFATAPVRILIQDSAGTTTITDNVWIPASAGDVGVNNSGFTDSTLDEVLTDALTSFGGQDWKYKESGGATERTVKSKFSEAGISVKDFGAVGDGNTVDTTAIQAAMSRAKVLSCAVIFPDGDYKVDAELTLSSATGVSFLGVGTSASRLITSSSSANILTLSSCNGFNIEGLALSATATNSGSAISMSSCDSVSLRNVLVGTFGGGTFLIPVNVSAGTTLTLNNCSLTAKAADATARALKLTGCSSVAVFGGFYSGLAGAAMEFATTTSFVRVIAAAFGNVSANIGILWTAAMTGTDFTVVGCPTLRSAAGTVTTPFDLSALSTDPRFRQWGNEVDGYTTNVTSGGTVTPDRSRGNHIRIVGTTTGVAYTIAAPTPGPSTLMRDVYLRVSFVNAAGGAITGWTLNAVYHTSAGASTTDTQITAYTFIWDPDASVWREWSRAVTT